MIRFAEVQAVRGGLENRRPIPTARPHAKSRRSEATSRRKPRSDLETCGRFEERVRLTRSE